MSQRPGTCEWPDETDRERPNSDLKSQNPPLILFVAINLRNSGVSRHLKVGIFSFNNFQDLVPFLKSTEHG